MHSGRHDTALRRRSRRQQRERGCHVYIPAEDLIATGIDPNDPPPYFRTWAVGRGRVIVRLYRDR